MRRALSEALKSLPNAPHDVVRTLALDPEATVATPVLTRPLALGARAHFGALRVVTLEDGETIHNAFLPRAGDLPAR